MSNASARHLQARRAAQERWRPATKSISDKAEVSVDFPDKACMGQNLKGVFGCEAPMPWLAKGFFDGQRTCPSPHRAEVDIT
jgi:hypothetical protein